jgi:SNF2 family DNA or RNA helicase
LLDLWSQVYILDRGQRLGDRITWYRERYFTKAYDGYNYNLRENQDTVLGKDYYEKEIYNKISDICISMKTEDWLDLPERIDRIIRVKLPQEIMHINAAALRNKLCQFANGAVYNSDKDWFEVHNEKIKMLEEILDTANGKPVFVFYSYQHDRERIKRYLKEYEPTELKGPVDIRNWNEGKVRLMIAHPASAGHGLNLQAGGHIVVWFGLPNWNLELYQQGNTRFHRQGQTESVIIHHLLAAGTMDEDMLSAINDKEHSQEILMQAVKARIDKYRTQKLIA